VRGYFYPVGRLDYDSEGLILLTNDGEFAERVTHPRYELERSYEALVAGVPDDRDLERLRRGVLIDGRRTLPADVRLTQVFDGKKGQQALLELTLREGRNRQVRDMCSAVAHPVDRLRRTRIGALTDRQLRPGQMRDLTPAEVSALMGDRRAPQPVAPGNRKRRPLRAKPGRRHKLPTPAEAKPAADRRDTRPPKAPSRPKAHTPNSTSRPKKASSHAPRGRGPSAAGRGTRGAAAGAPARADVNRPPSHAHRPRGAGSRKPGNGRPSPPKRSPR
jgi:pseudouridine synthase